MPRDKPMLDPRATKATVSLDAGEAESLCAELLANDNLTELRIHRLDEFGAALLASALKKNSALQQLDLSGNSVGVEGAASLASALETNATLQQLDLRFNQVGDAGGKSLAAIKAMLKRNKPPDA